MKKYIYFSILTVLFLSCKSSKAINNQDIDLNCEKMVVEIVRSSSLDWKRFPDAFTRIDRVENDSIFIKVFFDMDISDEPNTKQVVENTIAWLLLDLSEKRLYNITYDLENPKEERFNKKLIDSFKNNCDTSAYKDQSAKEDYFEGLELPFSISEPRKSISGTPKSRSELPFSTSEPRKSISGTPKSRSEPRKSKSEPRKQKLKMNFDIIQSSFFYANI